MLQNCEFYFFLVQDELMFNSKNSVADVETD